MTLSDGTACGRSLTANNKHSNKIMPKILAPKTRAKARRRSLMSLLIQMQAVEIQGFNLGSIVAGIIRASSRDINLPTAITPS